MNTIPFLEEGHADGRKRYPEFYCGRDGGVFVRPNFLDNIGQVCGNHAHEFDHMTFVATGSVHVKRTAPDGTITEKDFYAANSKYVDIKNGIPLCWFLVNAEDKHEIFALEDNTVFFCMYAHRDPQGRIVWQMDGWNQPFEISKKAYS